MVLGLTGGIASGKSTVAQIFRELGAQVVSADELAREVVRPGSVTLQEIVGRFGPGVLDEAGNLDRRMMAERIFTSAGERAALNRITHPAIARLAARRFREIEREGARLIVYDAPLLFEAGAEGQVDAVLVVTVGPDQQLKRLMARNALSRSEAMARIASQMSQQEKAARADFLIDNSGSVEETRQQVKALMARLETGRESGVPRKPGCSE
jgi:dephospho-CoA kinase